MGQVAMVSRPEPVRVGIVPRITCVLLRQIEAEAQDIAHAGLTKRGTKAPCVPCPALSPFAREIDDVEIAGPRGRLSNGRHGVGISDIELQLAVQAERLRFLGEAGRGKNRAGDDQDRRTSYIHLLAMGTRGWQPCSNHRRRLAALAVGVRIQKSN
jgi:hypothetical protein